MGSVTSSEHTYIAGGFVFDTALFNFAPALAISHDDGITWAYQPAIKPFGLTSGFITNASCNEKLCMAAGFYTSLFGRMLPYLIISHDEGMTWFFINLKVPGDFYEGVLGYAYSGSMHNKYDALLKLRNRM